MNGQSNSPGIALSFKIFLVDLQEITIRNFNSTRFIFRRIFKTHFLSIIKAAHINSYDAADIITDGTKAVVQEVNSSAGWTFTVKEKLGCVKDAAAMAANAGIYNVPVKYI